MSDVPAEGSPLHNWTLYKMPRFAPFSLHPPSIRLLIDRGADIFLSLIPPPCPPNQAP